MIYRVQTEIQVKLDRMEAPPCNFKIEGDGKEATMMQSALEMAFKCGYEQEIKEMKEFFGVK